MKAIVIKKVDFYDEEAELNKWFSDNTDKKVKFILQKPDPDSNTPGKIPTVYQITIIYEDA